jgi:putative acetyltransferase
MLIREATADDLGALLDVERRAFGGDVEADLVSALLADPTARPTLSLVALDGDNCVGHALFTAARITGSDAVASILGPLAVVPEAQGKGCGTQLVATGLVLLRASGVDHLFVLGHPTYYPRFGFEPALPLGLEPPCPLRAEQANAWMVLDLSERDGSPPRGRLSCADALNRPELWRE